MDLAPLARIIVRYAAGALAAKGIVSASAAAQVAADSDIVGYVQSLLGYLLTNIDFIVSVTMGVVTEVFYMLARKLGWKK